MTAFVPADLPSTIGTVEELAVWAISILAELNVANTIPTGQGRVEPVATMQTYRFPLAETDPERVIVSAYVPLTASWRGVARLWNGGIGEMDVTAIPAVYTED